MVLRNVGGLEKCRWYNWPLEERGSIVHCTANGVTVVSFWRLSLLLHANKFTDSYS